jgi:hypothetical protein
LTDIKSLIPHCWNFFDENDWQTELKEYNYVISINQKRFVMKYFKFIELKRRMALCQKKETLSVVLTMCKS